MVSSKMCRTVSLLARYCSLVSTPYIHVIATSCEARVNSHRSFFSDKFSMQCNAHCTPFTNAVRRQDLPDSITCVLRFTCIVKKCVFIKFKRLISYVVENFFFFSYLPAIRYILELRVRLHIDVD